MQLREALGLMDNKSEPFSIKFCSYDESRKRGGEIITLNDCVKVGASHNRKENDTINVKQINRPDAHPYVVHTHLIMALNETDIFI